MASNVRDTIVYLFLEHIIGEILQNALDPLDKHRDDVIIHSEKDECIVNSNERTKLFIDNKSKNNYFDILK